MPVVSAFLVPGSPLPRLKPEVLPLGNMPGWLPPFWLDTARAMTLA